MTLFCSHMRIFTTIFVWADEMVVDQSIKRASTIIYCDHWQETVSFYRDRIGLTIVFRCEWLVEFRLTPTAFLSIADQSRATIASAGGKGITLSFQIDDIQAAHRLFVIDGLAPTDIRSQVMGADVFYLFDPEGTRVEFWCPA